MDDSGLVIPEDRLPERFADNVDNQLAQTATAHPAATVVLMRDVDGGLEVLLLKRVRSSSFVPGVWVFPGGSVDAADSSPKVLDRARGLRLRDAEVRMDLQDTRTPAIAYYFAALREAFEETGILVGRSGRNERIPTAHSEPRILAARRRLLAGQCLFADILEEFDVFLDLGAVEYIAHWITPTAEPRRYDTRFFAAAVDEDVVPSIHEEEVTDAVWMDPQEALTRSKAGSFPMVFPTLKTLEALANLNSTTEVLEEFRARAIPSILPRLIRTSDGVMVRIPEIISEHDR